MRPILWGIIGLAIGGVGWVVFTVFAVVSGGHEVFRFLASAFGILMVAGIPIGLLLELARAIKNKKRNKQ